VSVARVPLVYLNDTDENYCAAVRNYANLAPERAMHGILFRFARDCWVRGVHTSYVCNRLDVMLSELTMVQHAWLAPHRHGERAVPHYPRQSFQW